MKYILHQKSCGIYSRTKERIVHPHKKYTSIYFFRNNAGYTHENEVRTYSLMM